MAASRECKIWRKMVERCHKPTVDNYRYYGALGIYVCPRWRENFVPFFEDVGPAPTVKHSIDRINNLGSYTCGKCDDCIAKGAEFNCRWATKHTQCRNQKRNRFYTHGGKTLCLKDWSIESGINYQALIQRIDKLGMPFEEAITRPLKYLRPRQRPVAQEPQQPHPE